MSRDVPTLRGWIHMVAFFLCFPATWALVAACNTSAARLGAAVFMASLLLLFGISGTFHLGRWSQTGLERMQRLDHGMIFLSIGGAYTPYCLLALPPAHGQLLLILIWLGAAAGILRVLVWTHAHRYWRTASYAVVSAFAFPFLPEILAHTGRLSGAMVLAGFTCAGLGAICYATRRPEPWPGVLGFHEVFHLLVVGCMGCFYAGLWPLIGV